MSKIAKQNRQMEDEIIYESMSDYVHFYMYGEWSVQMLIRARWAALFMENRLEKYNR